MAAAVNCFASLHTASGDSTGVDASAAYKLAKQVIIATSGGVAGFVDSLERAELRSLPVGVVKHIVIFISFNRVLFYNQNLFKVYLPFLDYLFDKPIIEERKRKNRDMSNDNYYSILLSPQHLLVARLCVTALFKCVDSILVSDVQMSNDIIIDLIAKIDRYELELQRRTRLMSRKFTKSGASISESENKNRSDARSCEVSDVESRSPPHLLLGQHSLLLLTEKESELIHSCISARKYTARPGGNFTSSDSIIDNNDFSAAMQNYPKSNSSIALSKFRQKAEHTEDSNLLYTIMTTTVSTDITDVKRYHNSSCVAGSVDNGVDGKLAEMVSACFTFRQSAVAYGANFKCICSDFIFSVLPQLARLGDATAVATALRPLEVWRSECYSDELFATFTESFYCPSDVPSSKIAAGTITGGGGGGGGSRGEVIMAALFLQRIRRMTSKASRSTMKAAEAAIKGTKDLPVLLFAFALSVKKGTDCNNQFELSQRLARQVLSNEQYNLLITQLFRSGAVSGYDDDHNKDRLCELCLIDYCLSNNEPLAPLEDIAGAGSNYFKALIMKCEDVTSTIYTHNIMKIDGLKNSFKFLNSIVITSNKNNILTVDTVKQMFQSLNESLILVDDSCAIDSVWPSDPSLSAMLNYLVCNHSSSFAAKEVCVCREILNRCIGHNANNMIAKNAMTLLDKL